MAKFLKGNELNWEIERLFENAFESIILISPYIQLHERYKSTLLTKLQDEIKIIVVFGKNEEDISKSMKQDDFEFFKQFPHVEILYEKRLHAKYYANESSGILTSMNLYGYSQNNNIEAGILMEKSLKGIMTGSNNLDQDTWYYFHTVIEQAEILFDKRPIYEKKNFLGRKKYVGSEIIVDKLSDFFNQTNYTKVFKKEKSSHIRHSGSNSSGVGYCIRTGKEIPFNVEKPMDYTAYKSWSKYKDPDYPEKFCHFSGEPSNGETSVSKPILNKNWRKAKAKFNI